ncbi:MAG: erythromycin esterase family protein [Gemmatimonadota bacterium]
MDEGRAQVRERDERELAVTATTFLLGLCLALGVCVVAPTEAQTTTGLKPALDALVKDVCQKQIVLLGEDANHGSGATLAIKVELVKRLVDECSYSAVLFESQVYDFIDLQHTIAAGTASPAQVNAAIGGLWSNARETAPLVAFLHRQAMAGRVTLGGLDPQVGGATQRYTQQRLPAVLAAYLHDARAGACETELARLTNWQYNDSISYDATTRARLRSCVTDIQVGIRQRTTSATTHEADVMATNLLHYLEMSDGDDFNVRDRAMFENLGWHLSRLPKGAKVVVWCATVHAVKGPRVNSAEVPMGALIHAEFSERAAAVGFSALAGRFGRPGKPATTLDTAPPESLEGRALAGDDSGVRYLDRKQLASFGTVVARALNYRKPEPAAWAMLLDGLIVLREEEPQRQ